MTKAIIDTSFGYDGDFCNAQVEFDNKLKASWIPAYGKRGCINIAVFDMSDPDCPLGRQVTLEKYGSESVDVPVTLLSSFLCLVAVHEDYIAANREHRGFTDEFDHWYLDNRKARKPYKELRNDK